MIYMLLDTSTPRCMLTIVDYDGIRHTHEWQADRMLAHGLLRYLTDTLAHYEVKSMAGLSGIGVYRGPGSFTGLRIGLTVVNTIADTMRVPIVGVTGEDWPREALKRLRSGDNDRIVMPLYGSEARITQPRK